MQKTRAYHEAAIMYNEGLADAAERLAVTLPHEEVKKWCTSVGKQHRFHAKRHKSALNKLLLKEEAAPVEIIADGLDVPEPTENLELPIEQEHTAKAVFEEPDETKETPREEDKNILREDGTFPDGCVETHKPQEESCAYFELMTQNPAGGNLNA